MLSTQALVNYIKNSILFPFFLLHTFNDYPIIEFLIFAPDIAAINSVCGICKYGCCCLKSHAYVIKWKLQYAWKNRHWFSWLLWKFCIWGFLLMLKPNLPSDLLSNNSTHTSLGLYLCQLRCPPFQPTLNDKPPCVSQNSPKYSTQINSTQTYNKSEKFLLSPIIASLKVITTACLLGLHFFTLCNGNIRKDILKITY